MNLTRQADTNQNYRRIKMHIVRNGIPANGKQIPVYISKRNFNRVKFNTSSLEQVLQLEGYSADSGFVVIEGQRVNIRWIQPIKRDRFLMRSVETSPEN